MRMLLFSLLLVSFSHASLAMKPYFPETEDYKSEDGSVKLTLSLDDPAILRDAKGTDHVWPQDRVSYPHSAVIAPRVERVFLIGGLGDPGVDLGVIAIYDFDGMQQHTIQMQQQVPDLEARSTPLSKGNFPWIESAQLADDGQMLLLSVVGGDRFAIDALSGAVVKK